MKTRVWRKAWLSVGATVGLLAVVWLVGTALAQGPEEGGTLEGDVSVAATVADKINYQGRLTDPGGAPLDGTFPMRFQIYDSSAGGTLLWDSGIMNVGVDKGLFNAQLDVASADFNGQALWIQTYVNGEWLAPRQELTPVPYALSLRPGAEIAGAPTAWEGWVFKVHMTGSYPEASAVESSTATGSAVYGNSAGGLGVEGYTEDGFAVRGEDHGTEEGHGYGGFFTSANGVGVYGYSEATSYYTNNWMPGVYGRSVNGVGVMGWGENSGYGGIGVFGYGRGDAAAVFETYTGDLIRGVQDINGNGFNLNTRFKVTTGGNVYADGSYHCGVNDGGSATYVDENTGCMYDNSPADFAEVLPVVSDPEPGDVLVIGSDGRLALNSEPYQTSVAGVYSTQPSYVGGAANLGEDGYVPLAVLGVAPVKVCTENGAVEPGDVLTTASLPGHAMRASPINLGGVEIYRPGTIVGKALEPLGEGTGVITALITLQ